MPRPGASAVLASAALVAGGMVVSVLAPTRPAGTVVERPAETAPTPSAPARLAPPPVLPATRARAPEGPGGEPVASAPAVLERALAELEHQLAHEPFDEHGFLLAARALAPRLDPTELEAALAAPAAPARLVAAAELLRARAEGLEPAPDLPLGLGTRLRTLALDDAGPLADAAARSLLALGGLPEARAWTAALRDERAHVRERAARALAWSSTPWIAPELASALADVADPRALALAGASLARLATRLDEAGRAEVAGVLATLPDPAEPLRMLALRLDGPRPDPVAVVLDAHATETARFFAAEELAREPAALAPAERAEAVAVLREAAFSAGAPAGTRRAALQALGALAPGEARVELEQAARIDPDPTIRVTALVALRKGEPAQRAALLAEAAEADPVPAVRAVAASELARATPRD